MGSALMIGGGVRWRLAPAPTAAATTATATADAADAAADDLSARTLVQFIYEAPRADDDSALGQHFAPWRDALVGTVMAAAAAAAVATGGLIEVQLLSCDPRRETGGGARAREGNAMTRGD